MHHISTWIENRSINILVQVGLNKSLELPDVPLALEFATTDRQRQILTLVFAPQEIAWPFAAPPGLPEARQASLRKAFDSTLGDPELLAEAKKLGLGIDPMPGAEVQRIVEQLYQTPADVVAEVRAVMRPK